VAHDVAAAARRIWHSACFDERVSRVGAAGAAMDVTFATRIGR